MNAHTPFDAKKDWSNPYCQNSSNDPMVDSLLGNAYHVVRTVYCNLGNLKSLYDFLNQYGMVIGVNSEEELKALSTQVKYSRIYGFSRAGYRQVTDYLYVEGDRTGIIPDDPKATGSWITVATSGSSGGDTSSGGGAYIPWVYANGSAAGGETTINVPDGTVGVPFIIINGDMQYVGRGFEFNADSMSVTLAQPLEEGDEVVFLLTGVPAVPDNPNVNDWIQINWLYNNGAAVGGEQVITIPYTFQSIPAVYKNGLRLYKGLTTESYTTDPDNQHIFLTEPLATNDRLIVQIGGEIQVLETADHTLQEVARTTNVKDSEVILSTDTTQILNGKKVVYDVVAQKIYGLPSLPTNVYIGSVSNGQLTYNPGNITVSLLPAPGSVEEFEDKLTSNVGASSIGAESGKTVQEELDVLCPVADVSKLNSLLQTKNTAVVNGTHEVPTGGIALPIGSTLIGTGQRLSQFSGDLTTMLGRGHFTKSDNTTVTITNPNDAGSSVTTDALAYVSTDTLGLIGANEIWGSGVVIRDAAFKGNAATQTEVGIEILTGGGHILENVQVFNTKYGVRFGDVYLSNLIRCHFSGAVQQMSGTSTHYDNVWARGHTDVLGAFHFENLNYSVLDSCCSDRPRRGAFYFKNCNNLTLNSCATEGPGYFQNLGATEGGAVIFDTGNKVTLNNFQISPLGPNTSIDGTSYTGPLITVGNNNNIIIERLFTNNAAAYTNADLYVHGNGSFVEIKAAQVRLAKNMPVIHIEPGSTSVVVVHLNGGNRAILTAGATKESPVVEYEYQREAFNPMLLIGGSSIGITYSARSGVWVKNGNTVTVDFTLTLSSKGALTGNLTIGNLPFSVPANTGGIVTTYAGMVNGPFNLATAIASDTSIPIRRLAASGSVIATNSEITDTTQIAGTITYQISDSKFNSIPV